MTEPVPTVPLPDDADLGQLRTRARELQRSARAGEPDALALIARLHPDPAAREKLSTAQLVIARRHGFPSWPALVHHIDVLAEHRCDPDRAAPSTDPATEFLRRACLTYAHDDGTLPPTAVELLTAHPGLVQDDPWVAAACAAAPALRRLLAADPGLAIRPGGPHRWPPIAYLAYARHDPDLDTEAVRDTARVLLDHGADPDTGFLWHGLPSPFTLLTGCFGEGELGPVAQPRHPRGSALARVLLESGADPNDAQALYNRMFRPDDDHLELLLEFGLGTGDGGPWRRRLGHRAQSPTGMVRAQLSWAVIHGFTARVALLADHGVDLAGPLPDGHGVGGRTPYQAALASGQVEVAALLAARGVEAPRSDAEEALLAAVLAGDATRARGLVAADPRLPARARARRPGLPVWAATRGAEAVRLAVELGWDPSVRARTDVPSDQEWETALHHAAGVGDHELARLLLELGADPDVRDERFAATPLDWARHFDRPALVELLAPLTTTAPSPDR